MQNSMANINNSLTSYDLHCHSTASDGCLAPEDLVQRAADKGVTALALTDHDTLNGLDEAQCKATQLGITLITGIELSTLWENQCLHVVGIGINRHHSQLIEATQQLQLLRDERAEKIADKLAQKQIPGALDAVKLAAGNSMITRSHFADFLLKHDHVRTHQDAFDRYLAKGKPAYVATPWTDLNLAIQWITQADGVAILAHPLRYKLTSKWMKRLLSAFKTAGGQGIEVVTGRSSAEEIRIATTWASTYDLAGSCGSDFHCPEQWVELGRLHPLPAHLKPVWELLR
ncbi:MAG: PHP domain-containing protein [Methylovulum sp.]